MRAIYYAVLVSFSLLSNEVLALSDQSESLIKQFSSDKRTERREAVKELFGLGEEGLEERLIGLLEAPDANVRNASAYALGRLRSKRAVEPLIMALKDPDDRVRSSATWSLILIGDKRGFIPVSSMATDDYRETRMDVAMGLPRFRDPRAIEVLLEMSFSDPLGPIRREAAQSLSKLVQSLKRSSAAEEIQVDRILNIALKSLRDESEESREIAAEILSEFPIDDASAANIDAAVRILGTAIKSNSVDVRSAVARALGQTDRLDALPFVREAINDDERRVRRSAIEALGRIGHPSTLDWLVFVLENRDNAERIEAAYSLSGWRLGDLRAIPALVKAAESDSSSKVREEALDSLYSLQTKGQTAIAEKSLRSADEGIRAEAVSLLRYADAHSAVPLLISALRDKDNAVRARSAISLGKLRASDAFEALVAALQDEDAWVADMAADALGDIGDARAIPYLLDLLSHDEGRVRRSAVSAIGFLGSDDEVRRLTELLPGRDRSMAISALIAIGRINDSEAFKTLRGILENGDSDLRKAAVIGLVETGDARVAPLLRHALTPTDTEIGDTIVSALGRSDLEGRLSVLRLAFDYDEYQDDALPFLAKAGDPNALKVLRSRLAAAKNDDERASIGRMLYYETSQEGIEFFSLLMSSRDVSAARVSTIWLARHGDDEAKSMASSSIFGQQFKVIEALQSSP